MGSRYRRLQGEVQVGQRYNILMENTTETETMDFSDPGRPKYWLGKFIYHLKLWWPADMPDDGKPKETVSMAFKIAWAHAKLNEEEYEHWCRQFRISFEHGWV